MYAGKILNFLALPNRLKIAWGFKNESNFYKRVLKNRFYNKCSSCAFMCAYPNILQ